MVKKTLLSKKGAASVFVMLLLVVLMAFGVAALTLSLSNLRLGQKVIDRQNAYYTLEGVSWEHFAQIDKALQDVYPENGGFNNKMQNSNFAPIFETGIYTDIYKNGNIIMIYYEVWDTDSDIGLSVTLEFDINDQHSLRPVSWKHIQ